MPQVLTEVLEASFTAVKVRLCPDWEHSLRKTFVLAYDETNPPEKEQARVILMAILDTASQTFDLTGSVHKVMEPIQ